MLLETYMCGRNACNMLNNHGCRFARFDGVHIYHCSRWMLWGRHIYVAQKPWYILDANMCAGHDICTPTQCVKRQPAIFHATWFWPTYMCLRSKHAAREHDIYAPPIKACEPTAIFLIYMHSANTYRSPRHDSFCCIFAFQSSLHIWDEFNSAHEPLVLIINLL